MPIKLNTASGGGVILTGANTATDKTITVPAVDATMLTDSSGVLNIGSGQVYKDASGNVGIGTSSPTSRLHVHTAGSSYSIVQITNGDTGSTVNDGLHIGMDNNGTTAAFNIRDASGVLVFRTQDAERARIDSSGNLLVGKTAADNSTQGFRVEGSIGFASCVRSSGPGLMVNRLTDDGELVLFFQANTQEGTISVSGTTVSYNGGHLSRWAQMLTKPDLLKGTVMSNLDEMNEYFDADGNPVPNEQLNKVKVSDVEGDANVAGVFVNWTHDEAHDVDEINMAMTGDMIIRIAQGVTVQKGDLLMSAGDGTAKPQGDDIVRSKTVAKVTSNHVTCTYDDGSYCVPCVLMAC
jgi:hypothetical protein